ncbi:hypothetical protein GCM10018955_31730 [Planomonospora venezuelensis]
MSSIEIPGRSLSSGPTHAVAPLTRTHSSPALPVADPVWAAVPVWAAGSVWAAGAVSTAGAVALEAGAVSTAGAVALEAGALPAVRVSLPAAAPWTVNAVAAATATTMILRPKTTWTSPGS